MPMTPTIRGIQIVVSARCGVSLNDLLSDRRSQAFAKPRQIAVWLCWKLTRATASEIGRQFSRDHSTIINAIKVAAKRIESDPKFRETVGNVWKTCVGVDVRPQVPHSPHAISASSSARPGVRIIPPALGGGAIRSFTEWGASGDPLLRERESLCQSQRAL